MAFALLSWIDQHLAPLHTQPDDMATERALLLTHFFGPPDHASGEWVELETHPLADHLRLAVTHRVEADLPLAYILGKARFRGLWFHLCAQDVAPEAPLKSQFMTYVPRPETEWIVEKALNLVATRPVNRVLELATGSGCIAVSLQHAAPYLETTAVDISEDALAVARRNAAQHGTPIRFRQGSWFTPIRGETYDLILCNPPYVPEDGRHRLSPGAHHEPRQAHHPEQSPEALYALLFEGIATHLAPHGAYVLEIGFGQFGPETVDLVAMAGQWGLTATVVPDDSGVDRYVYGLVQPASSSMHPV